ncbi:hypothetical protein ACF3NX_14645 (plasmid) [Acetobacter orientalis]|uniref:hypothetical protein n=1 Tax=Acetobacter orientalis TaxID=146474 RepID=UPI00386F4EDE
MNRTHHHTINSTRRLTPEAYDLHRVDQSFLDRYARHLREERSCRPIIVAQLLEIPFDLHALRDYLSSGGLAFQPWAGRAPARVAGYRHVPENRTPRIPEAIISPLLAWAIRYVTEFSADIFAARVEMDCLEEHRAKLVEQDSILDADFSHLRQFRVIL